jgi:hypothetical protein
MILVLKDEKDNFEEKYAQIIQIFLSKRTELFRIRIRTLQKSSRSDRIRIHNTGKRSFPCFSYRAKVSIISDFTSVMSNKKSTVHFITNVFVRRHYKVKRCVNRYPLPDKTGVQQSLSSAAECDSLIAVCLLQLYRKDTFGSGSRSRRRRF